MKRKFKVTLVVFLVIILGCFSQVFATTTDDGGVIGTSNLNGTAENSALPKSTLASPEVGWKRYDDTNNKIKYTGTWGTYKGGPYYGGSIYGTGAPGSTATFAFYGTKLRIITDANTDHTKDVQISIDGVIDDYSQCNSASYNYLAYEKKNLMLGNHIITITCKDSAILNAIDIDDTGYLINLSSEISLDKTTDTLIAGQTDILTAKVTSDNATNKTVKWASSNSDIVSVDDNGKITALKAGTATITATTTDGSNLSKSCVVTVNEPTNITLDKTTDSINVGDTDKLTATVTPAGQAVTWTSSDKSIATVDSNGNVAGIKAGTVVITATTVDGKTVSCTVTVKDKEIVKSKLTLYMNDKTIREFYLTQNELDDFINWYNLKSEGEVTVQPYYVFNVSVPGKSSTRKSYVWFMKIESFEVE